jgi:twitching motility protein PilI
MAHSPHIAALDLDGDWQSGRGAAGDSSRLGMQLGSQNWLLDLADVSEVIPVPELLEVPFTKRWFTGVASIRGNLVGVVDLSAFFGGPAVESDERARLVLVADGHRINSGLLFSRVIGLQPVVHFAREPDGEAREPWIEARYRDPEGQRWTGLSIAGLVTHPDFLRIELPADER